MQEIKLAAKTLPQNKQYNYCIDFMKGIACLFVVWMHCEFPGKTGVMVQAISRFCVPFFFMVSGYFCVNMSKTVIGAGGGMGGVID